MKSALALSALMAGAPPALAAGGWQRIAPPPTPAVAFDAGNQGKLVIRCDNNRGLHTYTLAIAGPAQGLRASDWTGIKVAGKTLHVAATLDGKGWVTMTASGSASRYRDTEAPGNATEVYDAVSAMMRAKPSIAISSGHFRLSVPANGLRAALGDSIATCGDPAMLAGEVRARSEP